MISELTPEQQAMCPVLVEKYKSIGLDTRPIDFDLAVESIKALVDDVDTSEYTFEYVESPVSIMKKSKILTYGNMDSYWVAHYDFFYTNFGICQEIVKMKDVVENCSWVMFSEEEKKIYIVDRPCTIKFDDQQRTHCENGPAIEYRDGFSVYLWHGNRVPSWWIMEPEKLSEKEFLHHTNSEMRRVACEIVGWAKALEKMHARVLDEDKDPEIGTLLSVDIPEIGTELFLKVMCGTRREFAMPVPPHLETAIQAQAWMLGFDNVDEFMPPEIRT